MPHELGELDALEVLQLYSNELEGPIPPELGRLAKPAPTRNLSQLAHGRDTA